MRKFVHYLNFQPPWICPPHAPVVVKFKSSFFYLPKSPNARPNQKNGGSLAESRRTVRSTDFVAEDACSALRRPA